MAVLDAPRMTWRRKAGVVIAVLLVLSCLMGTVALGDMAAKATIEYPQGVVPSPDPPRECK